MLNIGQYATDVAGRDAPSLLQEAWLDPELGVRFVLLCILSPCLCGFPLASPSRKMPVGGLAV